jgi:hypothetical protein
MSVFARETGKQREGHEMLSVLRQENPMPDEPLHPEITVEIKLYADKPMACMAVVRRALQKAGHRAEASSFTAEALAADPESVLAVAARYVSVE